MYCKNCGTEIEENSKFCSNCGSKIIDDDSKPHIPLNTSNNYEYSSVNEYKTQVPKRKKSGKLGGVIAAVLVFIVVAIAVIMLIPDEYLEIDEEGGHDVSSIITEESSKASASSTANESSKNESSNSGSEIVTSNLRNFHTDIQGDGSDVNTVMVYLLGSDLESEGGFASDDIQEMMNADIGDNVNLVIMTGGSYYWYMDEISSDTCQYWQVKDGELISLDEDLGQLNMASEETLTSFVNDMASAFPADRYSLILWNHGGGTLSGFGYDENYPDSTLTLESLDNAFTNCNVKFDFVGFDACLMATAETALMLEPHADYLIASQELEPGMGWHYTQWLTALSENPSISTVDLAKMLIDDFIEVCESELYNPNATLSIVDLRHMPQLFEEMINYFENSSEIVISNEYKQISVARSNAKDFGEGDCDQIDMIDYVQRAGVEGGDLVVEEVNDAVKYYKNSHDVYDSYGLAMYFPHDYLDQYASMQDILHEVGYNAEYTEFFDVFVSAMVGAQNQYSEDTGRESFFDFSLEDWYEEDVVSNYEEILEGEFLGELVIDEKGDNFVLSLTDEEWEEINKIELQALIDDGEGYIDLGSDNVYEFDDDGDLLITFDYTWVSIDGHTVPFYAEEEEYTSDGFWYTYGIVPVYLNGEYAEIIVSWDDNNPSGYVEGYRKSNEIGEPIGKGVFPLEEGDVVEWVIDFYTYEWDYDGAYYFGDEYIVSGDEMIVSYEDVGDYDVLIYFKLTDIYNNVYETEAVLYSD